MGFCLKPNRDVAAGREPFAASFAFSGGLISHQFFRPFAVTFDFASMRLSLQKATSH